MPDWSGVPWGTLITGAVAAYGAVLSTINLVAQRGRDRLAAGEAQRRQAEQVTSWLVKDNGPVVPGKLFYGLVLQNGSSQPVYDLIATVVTAHGAGPRSADTVKRVGDGSRSPYEYRSFFTLVPPGQTSGRIENPGQGMNVRYGIGIGISGRRGLLLASTRKRHAGTSRPATARSISHSPTSTVGTESLEHHT